MSTTAEEFGGLVAVTAEAATTIGKLRAEVDRLTQELAERTRELAAARKGDGFPDYATIVAELDSCGYTTVQEHLVDKYGYPDEGLPND